MSILAKLTVTPLLYACGVLLAALLASGIYATVLSARLDTAHAEVRAAGAHLTTARTERDAWKVRVDELKAANDAYGTVVTGMRAELDRVVGEVTRVTQAGRDAVAAAQAEAVDADRTLARMAAQFQSQSRQPACARALAQMAQACPAMGGY